MGGSQCGRGQVRKEVLREERSAQVRRWESGYVGRLGSKECQHTSASTVVRSWDPSEVSSPTASQGLGGPRVLLCPQSEAQVAGLGVNMG